MRYYHITCAGVTCCFLCAKCNYFEGKQVRDLLYTGKCECTSGNKMPQRRLQNGKREKKMSGGSYFNKTKRLRRPALWLSAMALLSDEFSIMNEAVIMMGEHFYNKTSPVAELQDIQ